ncbi:hypothetical protein WMY93_010095 [Mugilogobius chulae]|uniref:ribonuclease H n=1 Tax=Mugilogobius chulae TaxID=88201 RepID=A0AAW0PC36_9GOBI
MELASEDQQQPSARPKRDSCLPKHLAQYDVTLLPSQQPAVQDSPLPEGQRDESRPYRAGSASGYPSTTRSQRSSRHSSQRLKLLETMPDAKAAALEEQIKGLELADLQQEIEEERQADLETTKLDEQAREGQRLQEEAHRAKERMAREMGRRRRLKKLEKEVKIAGAVKSFLSESEDDTRPTVLAPPDSDKRVSQSLTNRVPTLQPSVHTQHPPQQQQSPVQVPSTVTVSVAQPLAPNVNPVMRVQTGAPMPATLPVTRASVAAPRPASVAPISQYMPGLPTFASTPAPAATVPQVTQPPATTAFQSQYPGLPVIGSDSTIPPAVTVANLPSVVQYAAPVIPDVAPAPSMPLWSYPGLETLIASSYGIPKPALPIFESGRESDFALLKMALDNLMNSHPHLSEHYKYQVLLSQLKLPSALQLAKSYMYDSRPYTAALGALQDKYGQPRQLVQSELGAILNSPAIKSGDAEAFDTFALSVQSLVGMLPHRDGFVEYCLCRGILQPGTDLTYTLPDLAAWLQMKAQAKRLASRATYLYNPAPSPAKREQHGPRHKDKSASVLLCSGEPANKPTTPQKSPYSKPTPFCPFCNNKEHYLNFCPDFKKLSTGEIKKWIQEGDRCCKCGRNHKATACTLKRPCKTCKEIHLTVLHDTIQELSQKVLMVSNQKSTVYIEKPRSPQRVLLKIVKVLLQHGGRTLETFAVLDDGSERSIILPQAVEQLQLPKHPETLHLRTVQQEVKELKGSSVSLHVSPIFKPSKQFCIENAFTSTSLSLSEHTYPVAALQRRYEHLKGLPLSPIHRAQPLLLIGSDMPHLLTSTQPCEQAHLVSCLHIATESSYTELFKNVERLWHIDTLPYTTSERVSVDNVPRYATPLLRRQPVTALCAPPDAVMPSLRSIERRLTKDPARAASYCKEMDKLVQAGYVAEVPAEEASKSTESWYVPHHMVHHNGKDRVVFNCSFSYNGQSLNDYLLPGPTLGPTMIGVLLRFRRHAVAISGDIKSMFHQIRLLPADKPLLRFLWRNMEKTSEPRIFEWQVLPFGTTCSPCCAVYALQQHVRDHEPPDSLLMKVVEHSFYVDNCLHSVSKVEDAKALIDDLRALLSKGGFEIRQWASNVPAVVAHLPSEAQSTSSELWLYDPLGYIVPFTTRCKVLIQDMWKANVGWDDQIQPADLRDKWLTWVEEIPALQHLKLPRPYAPSTADTATKHIHIFCDASERAYGSVAFMQTVDDSQHIFVSFVFARSRVAPRKQLSIPRLELSAALTGAQLARLLETELSITSEHITLWSDSTTVLYWIKSESCCYKVFVGTRVTEIQNLTDPSQWRYVDSRSNPADDITRGLTLQEMTVDHRWNQVAASRPQSVLHWKQLLHETASSLHGAADADATPTCSAADFLQAEKLMLQRAQADCFPEEIRALKAGRSLSSDSRLTSLSPEYEEATGLLRVGGRLRHAKELELDTIHPVILDPRHPVTKLLIKDTDELLLHPGPERVLAELRRRFWIIRGREAIRKHQHSCLECQRWRAKPDVPKMADYPPARLRLHKPPFYSTGVDCFGPFQVKIGRRTEKRWGIVYKCMTTRSVHLDLLESLDTDAFLLSLRRFISRRGKPFELLMDNDASDPDPVTPNLLLMGRHDSSLPQAVYDPGDLGRRRWRHSQVLADRFWSSFIRHYLPGLQERSKWRRDGKALSVGQVVLIVDPQLPRASWPVGRVTQTHPGADGRVRTASVQVKDRTYLRPVARLILLPSLEDTNDEDITT